MLGSTLSLLHRSLRQDSRLLLPHLLRLALVALAIWMLFIAHEESRFFGAPGMSFFHNITLINVIFISIAAISFFATAITEEKEEMTLGLLRMAGISPVSLLVGKSTPRLVNALLLLTVQFPFTWLAITLGGVTSHQVLATYFALLAYLLMAGNVALFCSVYCSTSTRASTMTTILLGAFLISPMIGRFILVDLTMYFGLASQETIGLVSYALDGLESASIAYRLGEILQTGFASPLVSFQVVSNLVLAMLFFGLSWATFGLFVRDDQPPEPLTLFRFKCRNRTARVGIGRAWPDALIWKDFHFIVGGWVWFVGKSLLMCMFAAAFALYHLQRFNSGINVRRKDVGEVLVVCSLFLLAIEIAVTAAHVFREEIRGRTHAELMMLPRSLPDIVYSKIAGCALTLAPAVCFLLLGLIVDPTLIGDFFENLDEAGMWWLVSMYILFLHVTVLFSLIFKWGGLPLAFGAVFLTNACCLTPAIHAPGPPNVLFGILAFLALAGCIFLHFVIAARLQDVAAV